jgi:hypothetical protein
MRVRQRRDLGAVRQNYRQQATLHDLSGQRHWSVLKQKSPPPEALGGGWDGAGMVAAGGGIGEGTDGIGIDGGGVMCGVGAGGAILICAIAFDASVQKANRIRGRSVDM